MEVERRESRSRSRTPFLGDVVDTDSASTGTAEASTRVTRQTEKPKPTNGLTNGAQDKKETVTTVTTETVTVIETKATKDNLNRSKAKPTGKKVVSEKDVSNKKIEKELTSKRVSVQKEEVTTKKQSASRKHLAETSDCSSDEEGSMRTIEAYRAAGEWWETFPKTDYTYSPASRDRTKTVAPGVRALPNMSRRSLGSLDGQRDSAFVSRTATLRKAGSPPTLPYHPNWLHGRGGHTSLSQLSDGESDDEAFASRRSHTETIETVSVWTRITTIVVTVLALADPRRLLRPALDYLYLLVAYVRVLDARALSALPWRPHRRWLVPFALLLLLLLAASWLWINSNAIPLDSTSALLVQWMASIPAMFPLAGGREPHAGHVTAAVGVGLTPMPGRQQVPAYETAPPTLAPMAGAGASPALDLSAVAALVASDPGLRGWLAALVDDEARHRDASVQDGALASAEVDALRRAVEDLRRDAASWRAELLRRQDEWTAAAARAQPAASVDVDAVVEKLAGAGLAGRLLADGDLAAKLLADGQLVRKLLVDGDLAGRLLSQGDLTARLLTGGDLTSKMLADGGLTKMLLADGDLARKLLDDLTRKLLAEGDFTRKLLAEGNLAAKLLADGDLTKKLLSNGDLAKMLLADGDLTRKLLSDGDLTAMLLANGGLTAKLLADGDLTNKLLADGDLLNKLLADGDLTNKLLADGDLTNKLLAEGDLTNKLLAEGDLTNKLLAEGDLIAKLLAGGNLAGKLLADGDIASRLEASGKLAEDVADKQRLAEDERSKLQADLESQLVAIESLRQQFVLLQQSASAGACVSCPSGAAGATGDVEALIAAAISRYDADKTGTADFALESLGGSVLSTRCSETHAAAAASITLFNVPLWTQASTPRAAIQPGTLPGQCWAFKGARGFLVVQLSARVRVSSVSIEHTPLALARNNRIDSAPRRMTLLGLATLDDPEPIHLGTFEFVEHGPSLQTFPVKSGGGIPPLEIVELQIESNHGNQEYTCLYRFRVHGSHVDG